MDFGSCLGTIIVECGRPLCSPAYLSIKNLFKFQSNVDTLDQDFQNLLDKKSSILDQIRLAELDGKTRSAEVSIWLRNVEEIQASVRSVKEKVTTLNTENLDGCFNCSLRYRMSKEVVEKLKQVKQLLMSCSEPYAMDAPPKVVEQLPGPSLKDQKTASRNLATILDLLKDNKIGTIGMCGMGGVGKTALIKNLNNQLESFNNDLKSIGSKPFSIVIWVTVSRDLDLGKVQDRIMERLKMTKRERESMDGKAARLYDRLHKEKFVLILDDIWEGFDIGKIGIPEPKHGCNKIILTTRSVDVCGRMVTDKNFTVLPLSDEEAWVLFSQNAGDQGNFDHDVEPLAKDVTRECAGLPLAIITVGRALRGKKKVEQWNHALKALRSSSIIHDIKGIEKELFSPLKWSYDSLEGNNIKPCFLFCCLYSEDFSIPVNELIQSWAAEGLIDEQEDHKEVYDTGISLIENLKDSCLLESGYLEGTVRMHDVVRDVAIWIASSSEEEHKSLVRSGRGFKQMPGLETWDSYKRVSIMYNKIETLPDRVSPHYVSQCSQVSTLLLQGNAQLTNVPFEFLQEFQALRVLNLSETSITSLPPNLHLVDLRALFLVKCSHLSNFPSLRGFSSLQVLDLSVTHFKMSGEEAGRKLEELNFHTNLVELYLDLSHVPRITLENSAWLRRLRRFRICIGMPTTERYLSPHYERAIYLYGPNCFSQETMVLWTNATALVLTRCDDFLEKWESINVSGLDCLKSLTIENCVWKGSMGINSARVLLPSLEVVSLRSITDLMSISEILMSSGGNIRTTKIKSCNQLVRLFPFNLLYKLEKLEEIFVESCDNLREIIVGNTVPTNALQNLKVMELKKLPTVCSISRQVMLWPCLKHITVDDCPLLTKLPFSSHNGSTIEFIKGELSWWNQVQWENEETKSDFQRYFQRL